MIILLVCILICIITLCIVNLVSYNRIMKQIKSLISIQEDCFDNLEILGNIVMEELANEQATEEKEEV